MVNPCHLLPKVRGRTSALYTEDLMAAVAQRHTESAQQQQQHAWPVVQPAADQYKPTQCHHMIESSVTGPEEGLLEAINS